MKTKIGERLKEIRSDKGLTQMQMAQLLGIDDSVYSSLERNQSQATFDAIVGYAAKLKVPVQDFFPELTNFTTNNHHNLGCGGSIVFGDVHYHFYGEGTEMYMNKEMNDLKRHLELLKEQNQLLRDQLDEQK